MHHVYILKSQKYTNLKIYIGYTSNLVKRLEDHNKGTNKSTIYGKPWKLVYYESFVSKADALAREKRLKAGTSAIGFLKRRIKFSLDSK